MKKIIPALFLTIIIGVGTAFAQDDPAPAAQQQPKQEAPAQEGVQEGVRAEEREEREWLERRERDERYEREEMERAERERAEERLAEERWKERWLEQIKMRPLRLGANVGMGVSGGGFLDVGVTGAYLVNNNVQFTPQINYRSSISNDGGDFSGVSVPLLVQFSTDYRRFWALFVEAGVGFDVLIDEFGLSVFNSEVIVGGGISYGRFVHVDVVRYNRGTAYHSWNIMNLRFLF